MPVPTRDRFERRVSRTCCAAVAAADGGKEGVMSEAPEDNEVLGHRWLLVRHGQTNYNAEGIVQGSSDTSRLSAEGIEQARQLGTFLATLQIDQVYVSPLARAQQTLQQAEKVAGQQFGAGKAQVIKDLREVDLHEWEGLYKEQIKQLWPDIYSQWRGDRPRDFRLESGKYPIRELWSRAVGVWQQILEAAAAEQGPQPLLGKKSSLLTGHNGINQALLASALGLSEESFRKFEFPNCGVAEVVWNPGEERARMWHWLYPTRTAWKTVDETRAELMHASNMDCDTKMEASSPVPSPCAN